MEREEERFSETSTTSCSSTDSFVSALFLLIPIASPKRLDKNHQYQRVKVNASHHFRRKIAPHAQGDLALPERLRFAVREKCRANDTHQILTPKLERYQPRH